MAYESSARVCLLQLKGTVAVCVGVLSSDIHVFLCVCVCGYVLME